MNELRIFGMLIGMLFAVTVLSGCGKTEPDTRTIDGLIEHIKQSGLMVTGRSGKSAEMIGASEGAGIEIYGKNVEVYRYDIAKEAQKLTLEKIAKEKSISIFSIVAPAKINGVFVMIGYDEHPEKERILKAFESWSLSTSEQNKALPSQAQGTDLLRDVSGVWKIRGEQGVFKFKLNNDKKFVIINDGSAEETVASVIVASLDQQNKIVNLALEADTKKTFLTLKQMFSTGNSNKFNIKLTLANGQDSELEFIRNIDSTDNLPAPSVSAVPKAELAPLQSIAAQAQASTANEKSGACAQIYKQEEVNPGDNDVQCSNLEFEVADKELNNAYKAIVANLAPDRKSALKGEQVAWIKIKEKQCDAAAEGMVNPRQMDIARNQCLVEMTNQRIAYLNNFR